MNIPMFFFGEYDEEEDECTEVYPEEWIEKAYSVTWFLFTAFLPVSFMMLFTHELCILCGLSMDFTKHNRFDEFLNILLTITHVIVK